MRNAVIGSIGAVAILLAALGLVVELQRGDPATHTLAPTTYVVEVDGMFARTAATAGPGGQCIPACNDGQTTLHVLLRGLPPGTYEGTFGDETFAITLDAGALEGGFDVPREVPGERVTIHWRLGAARIPVMVLPVGALSGTVDVTLLDGVGAVTLEQIGAVEVSALADGRLDASAPLGTYLVAWLDDERLGHYEDGVLDARVERLVIAGHDRIVVTLETTPAPPRPGTIVFAAPL